MTFQTLVNVWNHPSWRTHIVGQEWVDIPIVHEDGSQIGARVRLMKAMT